MENYEKLRAARASLCKYASRNKSLDRGKWDKQLFIEAQTAIKIYNDRKFTSGNGQISILYEFHFIYFFYTHFLEFKLETL